MTSKENDSPGHSIATDGAPKDKLVKREDAVHLASEQRNNGMHTLGVLLTLVEVSLGDTSQSKSLKQMIKREMYSLIDLNQQYMYVTMGQQPRVFAQITHYEDRKD